MSERKHNFNAGPAALPLPVLQQVQRHLVDHRGLGLSVMEMSHRSPEFGEICDHAKRSIGALYDLPDTHEVMFLQGGASLHLLDDLFRRGNLSDRDRCAGGASEGHSQQTSEPGFFACQQVHGANSTIGYQSVKIGRRVAGVLSASLSNSTDAPTQPDGSDPRTGDRPIWTPPPPWQTSFSVRCAISGSR